MRLGVGRLRSGDRLQAPEPPSFAQIGDGRGDRVTGSIRVRSAHLHPRHKVADFVSREFVRVVGRHAEVAVDSANRSNQQAAVRIAWQHNFAGLATFQQSFALVEPQLALALVARVALEAAFDQDRPNPTLEKVFTSTCDFVG